MGITPKNICYIEIQINIFDNITLFTSNEIFSHTIWTHIYRVGIKIICGNTELRE